MDNRSKVQILMDSQKIEETITAFAEQILRLSPEISQLAVVGIQTGGAHLARRVVNKIKEMTSHETDLGILDITLYRDDLDFDVSQPVVKRTHIPFKVSGKIIVLVDDVLYTGRTVRAALDALIDFGRPKAILLAVIIDRGLREFPIRPDFVGRSFETLPSQRVRVQLREEGAQDDMVILETGDDPCL